MLSSYGACVEYTLMYDLSHGMYLCASANIYECDDMPRYDLFNCDVPQYDES
jgi:hypothetical protein